MGSDFNGDGRDDILWRHRQSDTYTDWLGAANGGFTENYGALSVHVASSWTVQGTGDFNGDGRDDLLWLNSNGDMTDWLGTASGGFIDNSHVFYEETWGGWHVPGTGDFNGDGRDDILLRYDDGALTDWLGTASGGFIKNYPVLSVLVPVAWQVAGTGDFNGDGRDDILWRHENGTLTDWLGTANGGFFENYGVLAVGVPTDWHVVGTGDFNDDGRDDILWQHANGTVTDWLGTTNGGFTENFAALSVHVSDDWRVVSTGDFNGDGNDDILWRSDHSVTNWLGTDAGGFVGNDPAAYANVDLEWFVQPNPSGAGWWDY